jgi:hypothetical protein
LLTTDPGKITGAGAHELNNLLAIILSASEMALADLGEHPAADDVRAIRDAARNAAAVMRGTLAGLA